MITKNKYVEIVLIILISAICIIVLIPLVQVIGLFVFGYGGPTSMDKYKNLVLIIMFCLPVIVSSRISYILFEKISLAFISTVVLTLLLLMSI